MLRKKDLNKNALLSVYEDIKAEKIEQQEYIALVDKKKTDIKIKVLEYRISSVARILYYIHSNQMEVANDLKQFDTLITHCCNKLSGNIDGIEINLKEEENDN